MQNTPTYRLAWRESSTSPNGGKMRTRPYISAGAALTVAALLAGCSTNANGEGGTIVATAMTVSATPAPTLVDTPIESSSPPASQSTSPEASSAAPATSDLGTRENPAPLGSTALIGDWEVTVTKVNTNAAKVIEAENTFNEKPKDGQSFVLWSLKAKYTGDESASPDNDLTFKIVGSAGNTFDGDCGVIPDPLYDAGETFGGATIKANGCAAVDTDQIKGGALIVEELFSMDEGDRTFFALA